MAWDISKAGTGAGFIIMQLYRSLLDSARTGRVAYPAISEVNARLGMAQQMDSLCDNEHAFEQLRAQGYM